MNANHITTITDHANNNSDFKNLNQIVVLQKRIQELASCGKYYLKVSDFNLTEKVVDFFVSEGYQVSIGSDLPQTVVIAW